MKWLDKTCHKISRNSRENERRVQKKKQSVKRRFRSVSHSVLVDRMVEISNLKKDLDAVLNF